MNLYAYVDGDPSGFSDPFGHQRIQRNSRQRIQEINELRQMEQILRDRQEQRDREDAAAREAARQIMENLKQDPLMPQRNPAEEFERWIDYMKQQKEKSKQLEKLIEEWDKKKNQQSCRP